MLFGCAPASSMQPSVNRSVDNLPDEMPLIVTISGSTAALPMLQELTATYRRQNPDTIFDIRGGGSRFGESAVGMGSTDLAVSTLSVALQAEPEIDASPTISGAIRATTRESDLELIRAPIALSGLALIVHIDNPITNVTREQLQTIYGGRALQWGEVLGAQVEELPSSKVLQGEILLISREELSGARTLFDERVMMGERLSLTSIIVPSNAAVVEAVAANERAIGYIDRAYVAHLLPNAPDDLLEDVVMGASSIRMLMIDGLLPENSAIASQQYPFIYPLYIVYGINQQSSERDLIDEEVNQFIQLIGSDAGQEIVGRYHTLIRP